MGTQITDGSNVTFSTFSEWSLYWYHALLDLLRLEQPPLCVGATDLRTVYPALPQGVHPEGAKVSFDQAILVLIDQDQNQLVLAALPQWSGPMRVVHHEADRVSLDQEALAQAQQNEVELRHLAAPNGTQRIAYLRRISGPVEEVLQAGESRGFTEAGQAQLDHFVRSVSLAANVYFLGADQRAGLPSSVPDKSDNGDHAVTRDIHRLSPVTPSSNSHAGRWGIGAGMLVGALTLAVTGLTILGFVNGYPHEVVLQPAIAETYAEQPTGNYNVVQHRDQRICGDGEDFILCANKHIDLYNELCVGTPLTSAGQFLCVELDIFTDGLTAVYEDCGYGCVTVADDDGLWGWGQLELVAETQWVVDQKAQDAITKTEWCDFDLGVIQFGSCPR